jgi:hypothetical protein
MTDKIHDELDLDEIMEMIDDNASDDSTAAHQSAPDYMESNEVTYEEEAPEKEKDSGDAKLVYETMNSNLQLKQELERARAEKEEAERIALQGVLRSFETTIDATNADISRLNQDLATARDEGDTGKSIEIETRIRDNYERVRDLKGKVEQYSPYLNQQRPAAQSSSPAPQEGNKMAKEWLQENEGWLVDPKNTEKRDYANNLFKEMQNNRVDMNSLGFWTKFEKSLTEFDHKKSSEKQQQRMPKNMVTYNSNGSNSSSSKPASYKKNPEFIQKVAFLAKNVIKNEDVLKDPKMLNSMLKHYHKVLVAGNFKHLPNTAN